MREDTLSLTLTRWSRPSRRFLCAALAAIAVVVLAACVDTAPVDEPPALDMAQSIAPDAPTPTVGPRPRRPLLETGYAPPHADAFTGRMAGRRLYAESYTLALFSSNRFGQSDQYYGYYTYVGRDAHSGVLTLLYDGESFGGRCEVHLTFVTTVSGNESYTCSDGSRGKGRWRMKDKVSPEQW